MRVAFYILASLALWATCSCNKADNGATRFSTIDHFSKALSTAWENNSELAFSRLYFTEGADKFQIDQTVSTWTAQRAYTPETTITLEAIHTRAETEAKASNEKDHRTGRFSRLLKLWDEPVIMNGHTYVPNLSLVGYAEIVIKGKEGGSITRYEPIGIDTEGNLRLCLMRLKK